MEYQPWLDLYRTSAAPRMERVMTGFNVNLDRSIPVTQEILDLLLCSQVDLPGFLPRLLRSIRRSIADELFVQDEEEFIRFSGWFAQSGTLSIGGQAGIASMHLAAIGAPAVICLASSIGDTARQVLGAAGVTVIGTLPPAGAPDLIHLVFEHSPGLVAHDRDVVPRMSRFIVSPRHPAGSVLLPDRLMQKAERAVHSVTRLFLSGYQYLATDTEFIAAAGQINRLRQNSHDMRIHTEWVSADDPSLIGRFVRFILPEVDSLGVNEQELVFLCRHMNRAGNIPGPAAVSPDGILHQALDLCRKTGLARVHVHSHGYYCLVLRDPADPEKSRNSLLFASREAVRDTGPQPSHMVTQGIQALHAATEWLGPARSPGIFSAGGDFCVIVVPSLIAGDLTRTAGMGDRISSAAFDTDPF